MKQTTTYLIGSIALFAALGVGLVTASNNYGIHTERGGHYLSDEDDDEREGKYAGQRLGFGEDVPRAADPLYLQECGSCHFAYQPGLLGADSWGRMMAGLEEHFGDNAELPDAPHQKIRQYLVANSADRVPAGRSAGFAADADTAPLRITETAYFRHKHDEIPPRMVIDNPELGSWSRCEACHTRAAEGSFDEHEVRIPGVGPWDD